MFSTFLGVLCKKKTCAYILTARLCREIGQSYEEILRGC